MAKSRYSSYISSKTLWQNEIPSHWQETELRNLFIDNKNKNIGLVERNLLSLSYGKLKRKDIDNATGLVPASFEGYQIIDKGFIVLRFTDLQNDKKSLRVGYVEERGIITSAYIGLAPKADIHSKYFYYQLHFLDKIKYFYNLGGGVRQSLAFKEFGRETILIPPKEEQTAIARFLDYKLAKINRFIQKKKQLIKLLNEQKAAIINQAVTKGLDPNAKMKNSGIEWLGEIPEHWAVRKLKYDGKIKSGDGITSNEIEEKGNYEVYGGNGFIGFANKFNVEGENLIIGRVGAKCGNVHFINSKKFISDNALILTLNPGLNYTYYSMVLEVSNLNTLNTSSAQPLITGTKVMNYPIPIAPKKEQQQIVYYIEQETTIINTTISKIEKEIALVEEYKTALIAEAVTGKIDVRGYEIPEITEEDYDYAQSDEMEMEIEEEISMAAEEGLSYDSNE